MVGSECRRGEASQAPLVIERISEPDREARDGVGARLAHQPEHGGGVDSAAEHDPERHVAHESLAH